MPVFYQTRTTELKLVELVYLGIENHSKMRRSNGGTVVLPPSHYCNGTARPKKCPLVVAMLRAVIRVR